jgi:sugar lactone lactonase YvrE
VAVDSQDRVYLLTRGESRVLCYEPDGSFVTSWGQDVLTPRTHGIAVGPDDTIYTVDDGDHTVRKFSRDAKELMVLGSPGVASDTGYDGKNLESITRGGPPFNRPTGISFSSNGDLYICDGYGNARVHHFGPDGTHIKSWGEPGSGPGQFVLPHGICVTHDDRVLVADRENDRIQIFDLDGQFTGQWNHLQRPTDVYEDGNGLIYVASLTWRIGQTSYASGPIKQQRPGHISILDARGNLLLSWVSADFCAPGNFVAPHSLCADSRGDIYVGEVSYTFGFKNELVPEDCHSFQKLARSS